MKRLLFFIFLLPAIQLFAQGLSNKGKEFWLGYGHNTLFSSQPIIGANTQTLVLYLSAEQTANVTVSINGTAYSQNYTIPAGTVITAGPIPKAGANDARLTAEGKFTTGIHIVSDVPIVAYAHQFGAGSSGATMLLPVETYGYTYHSLNYTQKTNNTPAYSWFFVVASENNTRVEITPSSLTQGGRAAGVPFTVDLNKGEIYNVFGQSSGTLGNDMTGSKIKSIAGADNKCHPVGVFSGCSRIVICGNSGDIMQQQIFPLSAWGKEYLTYPTVQSSNSALTNPNYFRIAVKDPTTVVKVNGTVISGLINGFYYQYTSNTPDYIQADKPVLVSQYVPSMTSCPTYAGNGDPEMFYLSPLEQSINRAAFYNTSNQLIFDNYVVAITKTSDLPSLTIDGSNAFTFTTVHPNNNQYTVVVKHLNANQQHTIKSNGVFTAMTYGLGNVESYGYNAGTLVNNLDILPFISNTFDQTGITHAACTRSPFRVRVKTAFKPTQMTWLFSQVNGLIPNADTTLLNPLPNDSSVVNALTYYEYNLPRDYYFADTGTYTIPLSVTSPEIDNCNNTVTVYFNVRVDLPPKPDFTVAYSTCASDTAFFTSTGSVGFNITRWLWTFDDGTHDTVANPVKVFATEATHLTGIRVISNTGCIGDTVKPVVTNPKPIATFGMSPSPACEGATVTFTDTSSFGGTLQTWYWDFGDGNITNSNSNAAQTHPYAAAGVYNIKHFAKSSGSCKSDTSIKALRVYAKPLVKFGADAGCVPDSIVHFHDSTTISDGQVLHYLWNFGDANSTPSHPNTDTVKNPTHLYIAPGIYNVMLTVTTANGCSSNTTMVLQVYPHPVAAFTINNSTQCLSNNSFTFTSTSSVAPPGSLTYDWSFGDGNTSTATSPTHVYVSTGTFTVTLIVTSNNGCKDTITHAVTVNPSPVVAFIINDSTQCLQGNSFTFTNASSITAGTLTYNWSFGDGNTATTTNTSHTYASSGNYTVALVATSNTGCKDSVSKPVVVYPQPVASFTVNDSAQCLSGNNFIFNNTSSLSSGTANYSWSFGDGNTSTAVNPFHTYATTGSFIVTLVATSNNGCIDSVKKTVIVNSTLSIASVSSNSPLCSGQTLNLTTSPVSGATYSWSGPNGFTSSLQNPSITNVTITDSGVYSLTVTLNGCTSASSSTHVAINQTPLPPTVNSNLQVCAGQPINLTASGAAGVTYSWTGPNSFISNQQNPTIASSTAANAGAYTVTVTASGCTSAAAVTNVAVSPVPSSPTASSNSPLCAGTTLSLQASNVAGATYSWSGPNSYTSNSHNPSISNVTVAEAGVYSVTATINGCQSSAGQTTVVINSSPAPPLASNNSPICAGDTIRLNASTISGATYSWSGPNGFSSGLQNPVITNASVSDAGVYSVTATVNGCRSANATTTATVNASPSAPLVTTNSPLCVGQTLNLTAGNIALATYNWSGPNSFTSSLQNPSVVNSTSADAGVYSVTATVNGCTSPPAAATVVVNPTPSAPVVNNNSPLCAGQTLNLTASNILNAAYSWTGPSGFTSALPNPVRNNIAVVDSGIYSVTVTVSGCTSTSATTHVVVNPVPAAQPISTNSPLCAGQTLTLFASPVAGAIYSWQGPNGFSAGGNNVTINNMSSSNAGNYSLTVSLNRCNSVASATTVVVNPVPATPIASSNSPICSGQTLQLNTPAVAGATYLWSGPNGFVSSSQNPAVPGADSFYTGTYLVTVRVNGCPSTGGTTNVLVKPVPSAPTASSNSPLCEGKTLVLVATTSLSGATIAWTGPNSFSSSQYSTSIAHVSVANAGTYTAVTTLNGCTSVAAPTTVVISPLPLITIVTTNTPVCEGNPLYLSTANIPGATFSWTGPNGFTSTLQNPSIASVTAANAGTYMVNATANGCTGAAISIFVAVNSVPSVTASNNSPFCEGGTLHLNASNASGASYKWTGPNNFTSALQQPIITNTTVANSGVYSVTANNGCTSAPATTTVIIDPLPTVNAGADFTVFEGGSAQLHPVVTNGISYLWTPNLYLNSNTIFGPITTPSNDILYTLKVTGAGGCSASDSVSVKVLRALNIPNVFSPNGDGVNDKWILRNLEKYPGCTVDVYTRYGEKIFNSIGYEQAWDGTNNGKSLPVGTYYYVIDPKNGLQKISGWVTLLR